MGNLREYLKTDIEPHGWISKTFFWEEKRHKRVHTPWFSLICDSRKAKLISAGKQITGRLGSGTWRGSAQSTTKGKEEHAGTLGVEIFLGFEYACVGGGVLHGVHICQNSLKSALKMNAFYFMTLHILFKSKM